MSALLVKPPNRQGAQILVADDQPDILEALRLLLAQNEFSPHLVTTPGAVLEKLRSASWDLLLMDLNYVRDTTSGDEGLELLRAARVIDATLPIVVMTAWGNIELAVEAMRAGAQSFVQKPWDNAALVQVIQRETERGRELREQSERHRREEREGLLIQRALLPATMPRTDAFEIAGAWQPAAGFGGDTYDAFTFGPRSLGLSIADVAGKGIPAALSMSSLQAAVRAFALEAVPPHAICASVNRLLCGQMIAGRFATFCYVRLDRDRGTACYANAGHNPPLLARADGSIARLSATGTVLGVFPEAEYSTNEVPVTSGDRLLLYTDGITEARDHCDEEFGEDRLAAALLEARRFDAHALFRHVLDRVTSFAGAGGFHDDATLLVVAVR
jgi:sigma-B regulation protein RsbU (phosphoserine phosphatase)